MPEARQRQWSNKLLTCAFPRPGYVENEPRLRDADAQEPEESRRKKQHRAAHFVHRPDVCVEHANVRKVPLLPVPGLAAPDALHVQWPWVLRPLRTDAAGGGLHAKAH